MISFRQTTQGDRSILSEILVATSCRFDGALDALNELTAGWVTCIDGKPVGFALADRGEGRLLVIAVAPEATGKGLARELMRQAEAWLFSHGWREIELTVPARGHEDAVEFFQHLGWDQSPRKGGGLRLKKGNPRTLIKLEEHLINDPDTGYSRLVRLQRAPAGKPHRLCLFLDGESYWRDMDVIPLLNELLEAAKLPPMTIALVGHVSGAARYEDYTCNESYTHFIGDTVVPWLKNEVSGLDECGHIVCGLSLSGLMSVYLTLQYPQHFSGCISQSGSHWWKHEWFVTMVRSQPAVEGRFWLSVGDQETEVNVKHPPTGLLQEISQIVGVETIARVLNEVGGVTHYHKYHGGHSYEFWIDELDEALQWTVNNENQNKADDSMLR